MEESLAKWRNALPQYQKDDVRSDKVEQGTVLWLPPLDRATQRYLTRTGRAGHGITHKGGGTVNIGLLNHPILVVSRPAATPDTIDFLSMTSFGNKPLQDKFDLDHARRADYVPFVGAPQHPYTFPNDRKMFDSRYKSLRIRGRYAMQKRYSYVHISMVYTMNIEDAERYWGISKAAYADYKLDDGSLRTLYWLLRAKVPSYKAGVQHLVTDQEKQRCSDRELRRRVVWWPPWENFCLLVHLGMMAFPYLLAVLWANFQTTVLMWYARIWARRGPGLY
ncbi:hypothetical protein LTR85_006873 [Meristemomyces frigidus]|nr:hypothetical protein LTR85_006873 [Meristemomyces frigidus]